MPLTFTPEELRRIGEAAERGPARVVPITMGRAPASPIEFAGLADYDPGALGDREIYGDAFRRPLPRLRVLSVDDAYDAPLRECVLEGLIALNELSVWYGPPKSGKSFLMMRLLYSLSLGVGMWGREAVQAPVLYVAAEGTAGVGGRIRALGDMFGRSPAFHYISSPVNLFDPTVNLGELIEAIRSSGARVVAIDTLARCMGAGNESSTQDMGLFVQSCDRVREQTGAHIAVVHHSGWDAGHSRGSIALPGAADLLMKVSGTRDGPHTVMIEHAKEDEDGDILGFALEVFQLPPDQRGKPRSTCYAIEAEATAAHTGRRPTNEEAITLLREIKNALASGDGEVRSPEPEMPPCSTITRAILAARLIRTGWLQFPEFPEAPGAQNEQFPAFPEKFPNTGNDAKRLKASEAKRLYQRLNHLKVKGIIGFNNRDVWLIKPPAAL